MTPPLGHRLNYVPLSRNHSWATRTPRRAYPAHCPAAARATRRRTEKAPSRFHPSHTNARTPARKWRYGCWHFANSKSRLSAGNCCQAVSRCRTPRVHARPVGCCWLPLLSRFGCGPWRACGGGWTWRLGQGRHIPINRGRNSKGKRQTYEERV